MDDVTMHALHIFGDVLPEHYGRSEPTCTWIGKCFVAHVPGGVCHPLCVQESVCCSMLVFECNSAMWLGTLPGLVAWHSSTASTRTRLTQWIKTSTGIFERKNKNVADAIAWQVRQNNTTSLRQLHQHKHTQNIKDMQEKNIGTHTNDPKKSHRKGKQNKNNHKFDMSQLPS